MSNSLDTLSRLTGIQRTEMDKIVVEVKANQAKLVACRRHAFVVIGEPRYNARYRCANCGGEVDSSARFWYEEGRKHHES